MISDECVVGNIDNEWTQYATDFGIQGSRIEVIQDMKNMAIKVRNRTTKTVIVFEIVYLTASLIL